ncbi:LutC/YkgG family protein [Desulfosporosinus fructosivorans]
MTHTNEFISQLSSKLGRPIPTEPPKYVPIDVPHIHLSEAKERASSFMNNWQALGGKGAIVNSHEDTVLCLKEWFGEQQSTWPNRDQAIVAWDMLPTIAESAFAALEWPLARYTQAAKNPRARYLLASQAELGVTGADWGIALSGTLVVNSSPQRGRAISLLPPRHLTFIEASKLRDNLFEVLEELISLGVPPSAIEMISGPSRTSDIEMDLSIGVHGPIEVYVVLIGD